MYYRPKIFFSKKSYSMLGEDIEINNFFKNKHNGFYVDVGSFHPIDNSNTFLLYKKNWKGINIDANSLSIELFKIARKNDANINLAVHDKDTQVKLFFRKKINMLNTISEDIAKIHFLKGYQQKIINSDTLNSIIGKTNYKNKEIDFLNIDVEGNEMNVLKSLNFNVYKPKLICIEIHNHEQMYNPDRGYLSRNPVYNFLIDLGYKEIWNREFAFLFYKNFKK